jgi:acyl-CoA synthetase (AMP-forming)/AMP-acid ligase II
MQAAAGMAGTAAFRRWQEFHLYRTSRGREMFVAWETGACLCCPSQKQLIKPGAFINDARLTACFFSMVARSARLFGELLMTGPQLSLGYWQDEAKTRRAFVHVSGKNGIYYRTGDRVRRLAGNKPLVYLGRFDKQIKVLGHRVELGEVEAAIRQLSGLEGVVALGWPTTESRSRRNRSFPGDRRLRHKDASESAQRKAARVHGTSKCSGSTPVPAKRERQI